MSQNLVRMNYEIMTETSDFSAWTEELKFDTLNIKS